MGTKLCPSVAMGLKHHCNGATWTTGRNENLRKYAAYAGQEATVRTGHGTTDWFLIGKGVHQGTSDLSENGLFDK